MAKFGSPKGAASIFTGTSFADEMAGNDMNDELSGGGGNDFLLGGTGNDILRGDSGSDILHGGAGDDVIAGGHGNDFLSGDAGSDRLTGNAGNDIFAFDVRAGVLGDGIDIVTDFSAGADRLAIVNGSAGDVDFVQSGGDLDVYYNEVHIATLLTETYTGNAGDYLFLV